MEDPPGHIVGLHVPGTLVPIQVAQEQQQYRARPSVSYGPSEAEQRRRAETERRIRQLRHAVVNAPDDELLRLALELECDWLGDKVARSDDAKTAAPAWPRIVNLIAPTHTLVSYRVTKTGFFSGYKTKVVPNESAPVDLWETRPGDSWAAREGKVYDRIGLNRYRSGEGCDAPSQATVLRTFERGGFVALPVGEAFRLTEQKVKGVSWVEHKLVRGLQVESSLAHHPTDFDLILMLRDRC
jgi:hypothetical protein